IFAVCGAQAQHSSGTGVLCDTRDQIIELAQAGGGPAGTQVVNAHAPNACVRVKVLFNNQTKVGETTVKGVPVAIMELTVIGYYHNGQWYSLAPTSQYTLMPVGDPA